MYKLVYIDLDNVIVDYHSALCEAWGLPEERWPKGVYNAISVLGEDWSKPCISNWWRSLSILPWAHILVNMEVPVIKFLSYAHDHMAAIGKQQWVEDNFPDTNLILTKDKSKYAGEDILLIDDVPSNIKAFKKAGGEGWLFPSKWMGETEEEIMEEVVRFLDSLRST